MFELDREPDFPGLISVQQSIVKEIGPIPYELRKVKHGYKVGHKGQEKTYSSKPLSKSKAKAQLRALWANAKPSEK